LRANQFPDESRSDVSTTRTTSCPHLAHSPLRITSPLSSSPVRLTIFTEPRHFTQNTFARIRARACFGIVPHNTAARGVNLASFMAPKILNLQPFAQPRLPRSLSPLI